MWAVSRVRRRQKKGETTGGRKKVQVGKIVTKAVSACTRTESLCPRTCARCFLNRTKYVSARLWLGTLRLLDARKARGPLCPLPTALPRTTTASKGVQRVRCHRSQTVSPSSCCRDRPQGFKACLRRLRWRCFFRKTLVWRTVMKSTIFRRPHHSSSSRKVTRHTRHRPRGQLQCRQCGVLRRRRQWRRRRHSRHHRLLRHRHLRMRRRHRRRHLSPHLWTLVLLLHRHRRHRHRRHRHPVRHWY